MAIAVALVALVTYIGLTKKPPEPPIIEMPPLIRRYVELPPPEELEFDFDDSEWTDPMEIASGYSSDDETSSTHCIVSPLRL